MITFFKQFNIGDVEDPEIYAAEPIYNWQQTEHGRWVMEHAHDLKFYTQPDLATLGYTVTIRGKLPDGPLVTEYLLRWGNTQS